MSLSLLFRQLPGTKSPYLQGRRTEIMDKQFIVVGFDVAKDKLDMAVRPLNTFKTVPYNDDGIREIVYESKELGPDRVIVEATGGLERKITATLTAASLPVVVVNPRQVRDFAKATGRDELYFGKSG